ncbi:MAG TPA: peptidoglycan-associated lipoprotein Pal [Thermodesulfobacteriota bacterium]|nr:peptidoglycan-associated lipoprotein Pal [Thermodesulfobacteriota bacterium]
MLKMVRVIGLLSIAVMVLGMAAGCACWGKKEMPTEEVAAAPAPVEAAPAPAPVKEVPLTEQAIAAGALQTIYFDFDKSSLDASDTEKLDLTAKWLSQNAGVGLVVEGHCDERGTNEYNMALGERRANSAKAYLVSLGIANDKISTISYGEERPADPGHDEAAWAKNRRDEFKLSE